MGENKGAKKALKKKMNVLTDTLTREVRMNENYTQDLSQKWQEDLKKYENTSLYHHFVSYHKSVTMTMAFKDKLIEKLQNWLEESIKYRDRVGLYNLELVNDSLKLFKQQIDEIHKQYQFKIESAIPKNIDDLIFGTRENDDSWHMLKYLGGVVMMYIQKTNFENKTFHLENMNNESGKFESIVENIDWKDKIYYTKMTYNYNSLLNDYRNNTDGPMKEFSELKNKNQYWVAEKKTMSKRIKQLKNTLNQLNEEPNESKLSKQLKTLEEELNVSKKSLISSKNQISNNTKLGEKKISFLYKTTDDIIKEINDILKEGDLIMRDIKLCRKIESSIEKTSGFSTFNEHNSTEQSELDSDQKEVPLFRERVARAKRSMEIRHRENNKLERENEKLREEIRFLRIHCKQ